ncbi:hypothetical protein MPL3356_150013 [Mesorhizobium plurifarium]|uniref:Uncharacterized protein n=1 Tax=Mesorhizobium plurifarium TaxID=69974 RepID=A0A090F320_MESPL|nr:hypothetical protein MPL3356_150013 [Mesorhizobium plurifarium]
MLRPLKINGKSLQGEGADARPHIPLICFASRPVRSRGQRASKLEFYEKTERGAFELLKYRYLWTRLFRTIARR